MSESIAQQIKSELLKKAKEECYYSACYLNNDLKNSIRSIVESDAVNHNFIPFEIDEYTYKDGSKLSHYDFDRFDQLGCVQDIDATNATDEIKTSMQLLIDDIKKQVASPDDFTAEEIEKTRSLINCCNPIENGKKIERVILDSLEFISCALLLSKYKSINSCKRTKFKKKQLIKYLNSEFSISTENSRIEYDDVNSEDTIHNAIYQTNLSQMIYGDNVYRAEYKPLDKRLYVSSNGSEKCAISLCDGNFDVLISNYKNENGRL